MRGPGIPPERPDERAKHGGPHLRFGDFFAGAVYRVALFEPADTPGLRRANRRGRGLYPMFVRIGPGADPVGGRTMDALRHGPPLHADFYLVLVLCGLQPGGGIAVDALAAMG